MKKIESDLISINDLLTDRFFRIPNYQRPFKWEEEHFERLFDDLINADRSEEYFLGNLILHNNNNIFDVVDGQQRLTTLLILYSSFKSILQTESFKENINELLIQKAKPIAGIEEKIRLEVKNLSLFKNIIHNNDLLVHDDDYVGKRMVFAKKYFDQRLSELSNDEQSDLVKFLSQQCKVIVIFAKSFENAFKLFSIVNDRGMRLRPIDVIKANNISLNSLSEQTRTRIAKIWEDQEENLNEANFEEIISIIRFTHLKSKQHTDMIGEFEEIFNSQNPPFRRGESFISEVEKYAILYKKIFIENKFSQSDFINNLISIMVGEIKGLHWKACILNQAILNNGRNFDEYVINIEKLALYIWMNSIRDKKWKVYADIMTNENWDICKDYYTSDDFVKKLSSLYDKEYDKYLLMRYELFSTENDFSKSLYIKSIEHVLPQNPDENSQWTKDFTADDRKKWTHNIANLIPLNKSKNSSLSNLEFDKKKSKYFLGKVSDFITTNDVMNSSTWTPVTLETRFDKIKTIMSKTHFVN